MGEKMSNFKGVMADEKKRNVFIMSAVIAGVLVIGSFFVLSGKQNAALETGARTAGKSGLVVTPGGEATDEYKKLSEQQNTKEANQAAKTGKSFVPVLVQTNKEEPKVDIPLPAPEKVEAVKPEIKDVAVAPVVVQQPAPQVVVYAPPAPVEVSDEKYSAEDIMLLSSLAFKSKSTFVETSGSKMGLTNQQAVNAAPQPSAKAPTAPAKAPLVKAGSILHAIIETGVNSDEPSPVLAKIVSGELKGSRLMGSFQRVGEKVLISFTTISIPSVPTSVSLNAIAVDPSTQRTAVASDVDNHYFLRYGVLLATSFISGYAKAMTMADTTTTIIDGAVSITKPPMSESDMAKQALGEVATTISNDVQTTVPTKPTVYVDSGMPIGLLFMNDFTLPK